MLLQVPRSSLGARISGASKMPEPSSSSDDSEAQPSPDSGKAEPPAETSTTPWKDTFFSAQLTDAVKGRRATIDFWLKMFTLVAITVPSVSVTIWSRAEAIATAEKRRQAALTLERDDLREKQLALEEDLVRNKSELRAIMRDSLESRGNALVVSQLMQVVAGASEFDRSFLWQGQLMTSEIQIHRAISLIAAIDEKEKDIGRLRFDIRGLDKKIHGEPNSETEDLAYLQRGLKDLDENAAALTNADSTKPDVYFSLGVLLAQNGDFRAGAKYVQLAINEARAKHGTAAPSAASPAGVDDTANVGDYSHVDVVTAKLLVQCEILLAILEFVRDHTPNDKHVMPKTEAKKSRFWRVQRKVAATSHWQLEKTAADTTEPQQSLQGKLLQAAICAIWTELEAGQASTKNGINEANLDIAADHLANVDRYLQHIGESRFNNIVEIHLQLLDAAKIQVAMAKARALLDADELADKSAVQRELDEVARLRFPARNSMGTDVDLAMDVLQARLRFAEDMKEGTSSEADVDAARQRINRRIEQTHPYAPEYAQLTFWRDVLDVRLNHSKGERWDPTKTGAKEFQLLLSALKSEREKKQIEKLTGAEAESENN
jgi:hypothetical protein